MSRASFTTPRQRPSDELWVSFIYEPDTMPTHEGLVGEIFAVRASECRRKAELFVKALNGDLISEDHRG